MRPSDAGAPVPVTPALLAELRELAAAHGVVHLGIAPATVMGRARAELVRRRDEGLADTMAFTYRNPERSTDPRQAVRGAQSILVGALPYVLDEPAPPGDAGPLGRVARYAWVDHVGQLREAMWALARRLRRDRWKAVAFADDNSIVDREAAHLAGIGWFGKNANILVPGAGSYVVLGCVVTTAPLPAAEQPVADGCGTCRRCLDGCPTGAIVAPGVVDARRCLSWVLQKPGVFPVELREALGDRFYGCDDCQEVCPPAVRFGAKRSRPAPADAQAWVALLDVLDGTDDEVLALCGRWYLAERDPRWLRRNALVVLGNVGRPDPAVLPDARVVATIGRYVADRDPLLREHAVWAARRLGLSDR